MIEINETQGLNELKGLSEVDETHKRDRINLYFHPPIKDYQHFLLAAIFASVVGLAVFIISFSINISLLILAFILLAACGVLVYLFFKRKKLYDGKLVSDSELDNHLKDDILKIKEYLLERLNLDQSQLMIDTVYSSYYLPTEKKDDIDDVINIGNDGIQRFSPIKIHAVNFTTEELMIFNLHFDFLKGDILNEQTIAFYYKDIVTFSTDSIIDSVFQNRNITNESFTLYTSAGTSQTVILKDSTFISSFKDYIPTSIPANVIVALRKILREKKM